MVIFMVKKSLERLTKRNYKKSLVLKFDKEKRY